MNIKTRIEKKFTYQNENDTTLTYIVEEDDFHVATHLLLEYQFSDGEINPDLMEYNAAFEEASLKKIAQELLDEIKDYLDNRDTDSFEVQQGVPVVPQYQYYDDFTRTALYAFEEALKKIVNEEGVQKMNKYSITVTETSSYSFVIAAPDKKSAEHLFSDWAEHNSEEISYRLSKGYDGWEYSEPDEVPEICDEDISFDDALAETKKGLNGMVLYRLKVAGMPTADESFVNLIAKKVMESDSFQKSYLFTYEDVDNAIKAIAQEMIDKLNGKC